MLNSAEDKFSCGQYALKLLVNQNGSDVCKITPHNLKFQVVNYG